MKKMTPENTFKNVDAYLKTVPAAVRPGLQKLRETILKTCPKAEEGISYNMPAYKFKGPLVYFANFKNHCTFFAGNGSLVGKMAAELKGFEGTPSGIHFTPDKQIPTAIVKKIVVARMKENELKELRRMERKKAK